MPHNNPPIPLLSALMWVGAFGLGCGLLDESDEQTSSASSKEADEIISQLTSKTASAPEPQPPAQPKSTPLSANGVVIFGSQGQKTDVFKSMRFTDEGGEPDTKVGPVLTQAPAGTRGIWRESVYGMLITFGAKIEFSDGTVGYVDINDLGLMQRVVNVRSDDTLNVRAGQSHKTAIRTEIPPDGPVFVGGWDATSPAGCEAMTGTEKWWRVRTLDGVEGYVNCRYLGEF